MQRRIEIPKGFKGNATDAEDLHNQLRNKFLSSAEVVIGRRKALQAMDLVESLEGLTPAEVAKLIQFACIDKTARTPA